ncbi:hypothetical protein [Elongatibacter sediminis]|uniref:Acyl-protein synthetase LuxE domain-containing protein n=1 Tax=Elongatibacter sediminis TaxID=3119006 RepID=A0AAW9REM7_9GAMM
MSQLLDERRPYGPRDNAEFLREMNELTRYHLDGCAHYRHICPMFQGADDRASLPWLHVGLFKQINLRTEAEGIHHERTLKSSATSSGVASRIALDRTSSQLQSASTLAILRDFVGDQMRPLLVLDSAKSLRARGEVSARIAAALSLRPLASEIQFLLEDADNPASLKWDLLEEKLHGHDSLLVYGFTWMLWLAWAAAEIPTSVRQALSGKRIHFVHSGGWKKLEAMQIEPEHFNDTLTSTLHAESAVTDFYGLVEQVGIIFPLCASGYRHPPVWADVLVRDPWTLAPLTSEPGQLQLMNTLPRGAPYHNVLTEDLGRLVPGECACGRSGTRFELIGRVPKAEIRGCANV